MLVDVSLVDGQQSSDTVKWSAVPPAPALLGLLLFGSPLVTITQVSRSVMKNVLTLRLGSREQEQEQNWLWRSAGAWASLCSGPMSHAGLAGTLSPPRPPRTPS